MMMQHMQTVLTILLPLFVGFCFKLSKPCIVILDKLLSFLVYVILWFIGISLSQTPDLGQEVGKILFYSAILFVLLMVLNCAVLMWFDHRFFQHHPFHGETRRRSRIDFSGSLKQLGVLMLGLFFGKWAIWLPPEKTGYYALMLLIFVVGIQLRSNGVPLRTILLNKHGLWLSVWFMLSCFLAGLVFASIFPEVSLGKGLALASGYGWYSLSGIVMTQAYGATWGSVALLNDLAREFFALACIPLLMKRFPSTAIGVGGATSLDFTLPIIQKSGGLTAVPVAIGFGFVVNVLAPVLMVFLSSFE